MNLQASILISSILLQSACSKSPPAELPAACRFFTVGGCSLPTPIDTYDIPNTDNAGNGLCQKVCQTYAGCNYFTYDSIELKCYLLTSRYLTSCTQHGGTATPTINECAQEIASTCDSFVKENCEYSGTEISRTTVADSSTCQQLVGTTDGGEYFVYGSDTQLCLIYDSSVFSCSRIHGPDLPVYEDCTANESSSVAPTSATSTATSTASPTPATSATSASSSSNAASPSSREDPEKCEYFTIGNCNPSKDEIIEIYDLPYVDNAVTLCQTVCQIQEGCHFFTYDSKFELCYLYDYSYLKGCQKFGGTMEPPIDECTQGELEGGCDSFITEECEYQGEVILSKSITNSNSCQGVLLALGSVLGAEYFVYDYSTSLCVLYGSKAFTCSHMNGPATPNYNECLGQESSTQSATSSATSTTANQETSVLSSTISTTSSLETSISSIMPTTNLETSSTASTASTAAFTGTGTVTHYSTNTATTAATTASTVVCPGGWTIGIDSIDCYKFLYDKIGISWFAALQECESIGGFLAEPTSARENDMLASVATLIGVLVGVENWHIGLSDLVQENSWKWWRTQVAVTDTNWADGSPDITDPFNSLDCGIMFVSSASHNWKDVDCLDASINAAPICQYAGGELPSTASLATAASTASGTASTASGTASTASGTASTATASGTTASTAGSTASATAGSTASSAASEASTSSAAPVTCTTGWESFGGHCYMFVATTLNWQDAEDYCINLISGGHLVSINSLDEDLFVKELVQKYDGRSLTYWMGGAPAGATWTWTDGSAFNYDHTFNANPGAGECLFQRNSYYDNGWSSYACTAGTNLVCTI